MSKHRSSSSTTQPGRGEDLAEDTKKKALLALQSTVDDQHEKFQKILKSLEQQLLVEKHDLIQQLEEEEDNLVKKCREERRGEGRREREERLSKLLRTGNSFIDKLQTKCHQYDEELKQKVEREQEQLTSECLAAVTQKSVTKHS